MPVQIGFEAPFPAAAAHEARFCNNILASEELSNVLSVNTAVYEIAVQVHAPPQGAT